MAIFSWQYVMYVSGLPYYNSEISNATSISMSCSGDGLSIGDVVGFTLNSQVKDKGVGISKGDFVGLFYLDADKHETPIFTGVISTYTVNQGIVSFTAVDVISFTDNNYTMYLSEEESGTEGGIQLPIGEQYKAVKALLSMYTGMEVTIPTPLSNVSTPDTGWDIRELFSKCAIFEGTNYYVDHSLSTLVSQTIVSGQGGFLESPSSEHSAVSISSTDIPINCVQISDRDNTEPILMNGVTYEDYGIFRFTGGDEPTPAGTKKYVCPFITADNKNACRADVLLGQSNGCSFSCNDVLFYGLQPPYTRIRFSELGENQPAFYILQANYRLSQVGLIASISGTTKSITDAEFIGQTQKDLQKRIMLDVNYGYVSMNMLEGLVWDDEGAEEKNSG